MKIKTTVVCWLLIIFWGGCTERIKENSMEATQDKIHFKSDSLEINGMHMYYEIHGEGPPLVMLHGGGSTIGTSFGRLIPLLSGSRQLICIELQAHGRTGDREGPISFEQDADDVAALLAALGIQRADIFGFSNGGSTAIQLAIRYPAVCNKVIAASALFKRSGAFPGFWDMMKDGTFDQMPQQYKDAFLKVNPDTARLYNMFSKCKTRMVLFKDVDDSALRSVKAEVLLINGDKDVASTEHMIEVSRLLPKCRVAILPGGHGEYMGEITTVDPAANTFITVLPVMEKFLSGKAQ